MLIISFLLCVFITHVQCGSLNRGYSTCSDLIFGRTGRIDIGAMLYNCSSNIEGVSLIPSFYEYDTGYEPLNVSVGIVINNFISVDDVNSQVTMDFWYRNAWNDPRWYLPPDTWKYLNPTCRIEGLDITQYVSNSDTSNQLNLWLPDISFYEGVNINELAQMVKLFPNGTFLWSRHLMTTLTEENMNLLQYPLDTQNFSLTFQSYGYCSNFLNIVLWPTPVGFNDDPQEGENYIELNQLWSYNSYSAYVQIVNSPIIFNPNRKYSTGYFNLSFSRQSFGIVYRLALPIAIFLVLVGFSFWADNIHKRIDVTLQMLLVVAALYLVIGQIIPFVGYFTRVDLYVTTAFFILAVTTGVHFVTLLLDAKVLKYPANAVLRDSLVYVFRVLWVPCALVLFMVFFETSDPGIIAAVVVVSFVSVTNAILKRKYLKQSFKVSILNLRQKEKAILNALAQYKEDVAKSEGKFIRKVKKLSWFEEKLLQYTRGWYAYAARNAVVEEEVEQQAKDTAAANNERASVVGKGGSRGSIKEIELAMLQQIYTRDSMSISMPTSYNPGFVQTHFGQTNPLQQASSQQQQAAAVAAVGTKYQQYDPYVDSDDESD